MHNFSHFKKGRLPAKPHNESTRLYFQQAFGTVLPPPSLAADWTGGDKTRPMYGNDDIGDCTCAEVANSLVSTVKVVHGTELNISTNRVLSMYSAITGFNPHAPLDANGDNPTDTGANIEDVLAWVGKHGFDGHHLLGTVAVDPKDIDNVKRSIDWFGSVDLGVALPPEWTNDGVTSWNAPPAGTPMTGQWAPTDGHSICGNKYDAGHIYVWTWGELIPVTWAAFSDYFDEVDAVLWDSWIQHGAAPDHLSYTILENYMRDVAWK